MKITPINGKTETEGSLLVYRGVKLMVARSGNNNFNKVLRELIKPFKKDFDSGEVSEKVSNEIMIESVAKTILVGWSNFKDAEGKSYDYSLKNAIELLNDDKDCYEAINEFSNDINNYILESIEDSKVK